jgi:hypothetical protein
VASDSGVVVSPADTYKLNHLFATTLLFGQYSAMIFQTLSKNENLLREN